MIRLAIICLAAAALVVVVSTILDDTVEQG